MLRLLLLLLGLLTLIALIWHVGPAQIVAAAMGLGPGPLVVILLPSILMYVLDAGGWRMTLGRHARAVSFWRLFAIRTAGEVVNMTTPAAYVGGEPLKAYLMKQHGVPMVEGLASVVTAKTTMTIAQVVFILLGVTIGAWITTHDRADGTLPDPSVSVQILAALLSVGLLMFGTAIFVLVQRRGLFTGILRFLRRCRIRIPFLETREEKLQALDDTITGFYRHARHAFVLSMGLFFLGWLAEALEVFVILHYLHPPADALTSIAIGALAVLIKGGTFFIPGSVGAQEAGNMILLVAYGYSDVMGITFAILRRLRELVWIAIGLLCLAVMGGFSRRGTAADVPP